MDDREKQRHAIGRRVSTLIARDPSFREWLGFVAPDGSRPIVVALLDDAVGDVFDHVERRYPGGANVIVGVENGRLSNLIVRHEDDHAEFGSMDSDCPIHRDSAMAMLFAYCTLRGGEEVRCTLITSDYEVEATPELVG